MLRFRTSLLVIGLACGVSMASAQSAPKKAEDEKAKPSATATATATEGASAAPAKKQAKAKPAKKAASTAKPAADSGKPAEPTPPPTAASAPATTPAAATTVAAAGQPKAPPTAAAPARPSGPTCKIEEPEQPRGGRLEVVGGGFGQTPLVRVAGQPLRMIERRADRLSVQIPADSNGGPVVVQAEGRSQPCGQLVIIGKNR